jgi:RHS repeat-associated protein
MTNTPFTNGQPGTPTTYTYVYDVLGSVSQLVAPDGSATASYGYTAYGQSDSQLSLGDTDQTAPLNPFRYTAKRADSGSATLDTGVRRFGPGAGQFLTPDFFNGSLADLSLSIDPLTQNRYDLAGGNPISFGEWDGHLSCDVCGAFFQTVTGIKDPGAFVQGVKDGLGDLGQGALAPGKLAVECAPSGPTEELGQCGSHVSAIATNIKNDPGGFLGSLVDAKDFQAGLKKGDLSYWEGRITPSLVITIASFGTGGAAVKAGEGVGTAARAEQAVSVAARAGKVESAAAKAGRATEAASETPKAGKPAASSGAPRASEGPAGGSGAPKAAANVGGPSTLFHYTNESGLKGILDSGTLNPSLKAINPRDVRYGNGQYLSDVAPGAKTPAQLSRAFLGNPFQGARFTRYVEVDVRGLNVVQGRSGVFVIPGEDRLSLFGRIVSSGGV